MGPRLVSIRMGKRHAGTHFQRDAGLRDESSVSRHQPTTTHHAPLFFYSFVFDNYTWARDGPEYAEFNGKLIPARIPLSAIISGASCALSHVLVLTLRPRAIGPIIGSAFRPGDPAARAVHKDYFKRVCPNPTVLDSDAVVNGYIRYDDNIPASQIFDMWVEKLNSINDPCVEIQLDSPQLFEIWCVFGRGDVALTTADRIRHTPSSGYSDHSVSCRCGPGLPSHRCCVISHGLRSFWRHLPAMHTFLGLAASLSNTSHLICGRHRLRPRRSCTTLFLYYQQQR